MEAGAAAGRTPAAPDMLPPRPMNDPAEAVPGGPPPAVRRVLLPYEVVGSIRLWGQGQGGAGQGW